MTSISERKIIKGLGEITLRVSNLDTMQKFYEQVIGLEFLYRSDDAVFFKVADGYGGHSQVMVRFDRSKRPGYLGIDAKIWQTLKRREDVWKEWVFRRRRLSTVGCIGGLSVRDPEGNEVELVCYHEKGLTWNSVFLPSSRS